MKINTEANKDVHDFPLNFENKKSKSKNLVLKIIVSVSLLTGFVAYRALFEMTALSADCIVDRGQGAMPWLIPENTGLNAFWFGVGQLSIDVPLVLISTLLYK